MSNTNCPECGHDQTSLDTSDLPDLITVTTVRIADELHIHPASVLRTRPGPKHWSPLEYACHVRDVLLVQRDRLYRALVEDEPDCTPMHRDRRAVLARYNHQDPLHVASQTIIAADLAADAFVAVDAADWNRPLLYHWPATRIITIAELAHHSTHETVHHLNDIRKNLQQETQPHQ